MRGQFKDTHRGCLTIPPVSNNVDLQVFHKYTLFWIIYWDIFVNAYKVFPLLLKHMFFYFLSTIGDCLMCFCFCCILFEYNIVIWLMIFIQQPRNHCLPWLHHCFILMQSSRNRKLCHRQDTGFVIGCNETWISYCKDLEETEQRLSLETKHRASSVQYTVLQVNSL